MKNSNSMTLESQNQIRYPKIGPKVAVVRNILTSANRIVKTTRNYIENHAGSAQRRLNLTTFDIRNVRSKGASVHKWRTPPGLTKRLPNEECFAPCTRTKPLTLNRHRRQQRLCICLKITINRWVNFIPAPRQPRPLAGPRRRRQ